MQAGKLTKRCRIPWHTAHHHHECDTPQNRVRQHSRTKWTVKNLSRLGKTSVNMWWSIPTSDTLPYILNELMPFDLFCGMNLWFSAQHISKLQSALGGNIHNYKQLQSLRPCKVPLVWLKQDTTRSQSASNLQVEHHKVVLRKFASHFQDGWRLRRLWWHIRQGRFFPEITRPFSKKVFWMCWATRFQITSNSCGFRLTRWFIAM